MTLWNRLIIRLFPSRYPLVSSDYPYGTFCFPIWYIQLIIIIWHLLLTPFVPSDYLSVTLLLLLWYPLITLLILVDNSFRTFCLSLWYFLIVIFYHPVRLWYLLLTPLVPSDYPFDTF